MMTPPGSAWSEPRWLSPTVDGFVGGHSFSAGDWLVRLRLNQPTASVKIVDPGTLVRKHGTYSDHLHQKIVRAAEPGCLEHLRVRYIGSSIMSDAVEKA